MSRNRKTHATRTGNGFEVSVQRTADPRNGFYLVHVRESGEVSGLPGGTDDRVIVLLADAEIRAAGYPQLADRMLRWFDNR